MEITATAPNRVDLAGGTTDIHPLYLLMEGGCTVNVAVSVRSRVCLRTLEEPKIRLISKDMGHSLEAWPPVGLPLDGPMGLIGRAVRAAPPEHGIEIVTLNEAPAGSGLGASSALLAAALAVLLKLRHEDYNPRDIIHLATNIETAAIGVPTGKQDHIAAVYGGISLIEFGYRDFTRETIRAESKALEYLRQTLVLTYTGQGRFSGMNNWEITKRFIDNDKEVKAKLLRIRDIARAVYRALDENRFGDVPTLVQQEWEVRRTLAPGVSTARIEALIAAASKAGALASKICGAGGGGCMMTLVPEEKRSAVSEALDAAGGKVMPFEIDRQGLVVSES
jgi:D-glycero-alpha-D-manno-heptose-7-phosphate kinase